MAENKLYPPYVEASIPATLVPSASTSETTTTLIVPFRLNKAVSWVDLGEEKRMSLILKTVSTSKVLLDGFQGQVITYNAATGTPAAKFEIPRSTFLPSSGQYYKIQIAFISSTDKVGYYSDVTVGKFTDAPTVLIEDLDQTINSAKYSYTGSFETSDVSEKVYYYEFNIYDNETGLLHDTSGRLIHNSNTDIERGKSSDTWTSYKTLVNERQYSISYKVITINGLEIETPAYAIASMETLDLVSKNTEFIATLHSDDGYIHIHIMPKDIDANIKAITGNFILVRSSSEDNFSSWHEIYKFTLVNNYPLMTLWKDFTVQQGYSYKYAVQAYNSKEVFSNRLECKYYLCEADEKKDNKNRQNWNAEGNSSENTNFSGWHYLQENNGAPTRSGLPVDFEDAFLYDGKRQLKIKYNPKVSSFKNTVLEAKVNTLGGQFPFIFRNGNVSYKEFPISGLITLLSDENSLFVEDLYEASHPRNVTTHPPYSDSSDWWFHHTGLSEWGNRTLQESQASDFRTALTADNFRREREFKLEVLRWLNNGQPKLFRSPGEGNYIVQLMGTSLSPNDTLSRMIHSFSCNACEIAEFNFSNLQKYGFINALEASYQELKFKMIDAQSYFDDVEGRQLMIDNGAYYMAIIDQYGYWAIRVHYANGTSTIINCGNSTGQFLFDKDSLKTNPIVAITYLEGVPDIKSKFLYGYYEASGIAFSLISEVEREIVVDQIIGHPATDTRLDSFNINYISTILNGYGYKSGEKQLFYGSDKIPKRTVGKFHYLKAEPREITNIYLSNKKYYYNQSCDHEIVTWDDTAIYAVHSQQDGSWTKAAQYSGRPSNNIPLDNPSYLLKVNTSPNNGLDPPQEEVVDLSLRGGTNPTAPITSGRYEFYFDLDKVESIYVGSGLVCEVCYNVNIIHYEVESNSQYSALQSKMTSWNTKKNSYNSLLQNGTSKFSSNAEEARKEMESAYHVYLTQLKDILTNLQKDGGTYYAL